MVKVEKDRNYRGAAQDRPERASASTGRQSGDILAAMLAEAGVGRGRLINIKGPALVGREVHARCACGATGSCMVLEGAHYATDCALDKAAKRIDL